MASTATWIVRALLDDLNDRSGFELSGEQYDQLEAEWEPIVQRFIDAHEDWDQTVNVREGN